MLKKFIDQLSKDLDMRDFITDNKDGSYMLDFEKDLHISAKESRESGISLYATIGQKPRTRLEEFLLKTMTANLFGRETGGAILGLDVDGNKVVMVRFLPDKTNYKDFHDHLEEFVNYVEAWKIDTFEFTKQEK